LTELLQRTAVKVSDRGELVVLQIAGSSWTLEFATALELAALMKREARAAKASAGDDSFRHNVAGVLHDAAAEKKFVSRFRRVLPERLALKKISVKAKGQIVEVRICAARMGTPYQAAAQIAQWLRLHGKVARNTAGERAHWSRLVRPDSLIARAG
jgi:hypothetical protein